MRQKRGPVCPTESKKWPYARSPAKESVSQADGEIVKLKKGDFFSYYYITMTGAYGDEKPTKVNELRNSLEKHNFTPADLKDLIFVHYEML
jgi:hypothetical protein